MEQESHPAGWRPMQVDTGWIWARVLEIMRCKATLARGLILLGLTIPVYGGEVQRIGHTNLAPRHTAPDDKGMYAAAIDPTNGYAYFIGSWMVKLDITGNLPVQVGPALVTGQSSSIAIDVAAGYLYQSLGSGVTKFALGNGASSMTNLGSLSLAAGSSQGIVVDDSDPNPANHNLYAVCVVSGNPARVAKVSLNTFTEQGFVSLGTGLTNTTLGHTVDARKGYAYFVMGGIPNTTNGPRVVKIKMTPGASAPVLIGAANLDTTGTNLFLDGGSIDTVHGYAYYGTYDSDTNIPGHVYKVKLENGDVPPTLVGRIDLHAGEGRLAASFCDPANGFVYFADDNTYPGHLYQLAMNGTNLPIEIGRTPMQGTTNVPPPDGTTSTNTTVNSDGVLPFGEVYFRSAVIDPVRGFAYLGQDSRPNQVVKVQVAKVDPFTLNNPHVADGSFQFNFTNIMGASFVTYASTNAAQMFSNWNALGSVMETAPGQYQFTDPQATASSSKRFYRAGQGP